MAQTETEEAEAVESATRRLFRVFVAREAGDHGDVRVDRVPDRDALVLERVVVIVDPVLGLVGIDECEGQRADTQLRREVDGLAVRAGDPDRRVRLLHGLGHHVAAGHFDVVALEARVRVHRHHVGGLLDGLPPHLPLLVDVDPEPAEFRERRRFTGAELDAALRDQVERGDALGDARRVVVLRRHQHDAVPQPDVLRALRTRGQEDLGRRGVRVLLEEVVLHLPRVVDAELVGELDLVERILEQLQLVAVVPGARQLVRVEDSELHGPTSVGCRASLIDPKIEVDEPIGFSALNEYPEIFQEVTRFSQRAGRSTGRHGAVACSRTPARGADR